MHVFGRPPLYFAYINGAGKMIIKPVDLCTMNKILGVVLFATIAIQLASATSPPIRLFKSVAVDSETRHAAEKALEQLKQFFGTSPQCQLKIDEIFTVEQYKSDETVNKYTMKLTSGGKGCPTQTKICSNVQVFIPTPRNCDDPSGECFNLTETLDIQCIPEVIDGPISQPVLAGNTKNIDNPNSNPVFQDFAREAIKFLYHKINTKTVCPLFLKEIIRASEKEINDGLDIEFELQVETHSVDYDCDYVLLNCANLKVHQQKLDKCTDSQSCLIPVDLDKVNCINIDQVLF